MPDKIPEHILARKNDSPEEFKAQQDRIAKWVLDKQTEAIEKHANEGKNK